MTKKAVTSYVNGPLIVVYYKYQLRQKPGQHQQTNKLLQNIVSQTQNPVAYEEAADQNFKTLGVYKTFLL